jgi:hypothetical protein
MDKFFVHNAAAHRGPSHKNWSLALRTKSRALKELQLCVLATYRNSLMICCLLRSCIILLRYVCIFTAVYFEILTCASLLEMNYMHYAIYTVGLTDLLKSIVVSGADEGQAWSNIDNTYIDDMSCYGQPFFQLW